MNQEYEWMVTPTAHEAWVRRKGVIVWLSFAFGVVGAGAYLVSAFIGDNLALIGSWAIVTLLKNFMHLLHAKNPKKMWRMILKPGRSWIARGTIVTTLFSLLGGVQIIWMLVAPGTIGVTVFKVLAGFMAAAIIFYEGATLRSMRGVPLWNHINLPLLLFMWAVFLGFGFVLAVNDSLDNAHMLVLGGLGLGLGLVVMTLLYLAGVFWSGGTGKESVAEMLVGDVALVFWIGVVIIGMAIPMGGFLVWMIRDVGVWQNMGGLIVAGQVIGCVAFLYGVLRAGKYCPVVI